MGERTERLREVQQAVTDSDRGARSDSDRAAAGREIRRAGNQVRMDLEAQKRIANAHDDVDEARVWREPSIRGATVFLAVFVVLGILALMIGLALILFNHDERSADGMALVGGAICIFFGAMLLALARRAVIALVRIERKN